MGFAILLKDENRNVGITLVKATIAMFTLPIITFYVVYNMYIQQNSTPVPVLVSTMLDDNYDNAQQQQRKIQLKVSRLILDQANTYGGIAAVVCANIIIAIYCYYAYIEDTYDNDNKDQQSLFNKNDDTGKIIPPRVGTFTKTRVD